MMSAYYRNNGYEEDPDYPDYSWSQNQTQRYLKNRDYPDFSGPLTNPDYPRTRNNPHASSYRANTDYPGPLAEPDYPEFRNNPDYSSSRRNTVSDNSRTNQDYSRSLAQPDYPGSQGSSDYPSARRNLHASGSRRNPDYPESLAKSDYNVSWSNPYQPGSSREPDYPGSQQQDDFTGSRGSASYGGSRTNPGYLGSLEEPDYPGFQNTSNYLDFRASSNHPASRRNPERASTRANLYTHPLEEPDYPGAVRNANPADIWGEPDYPVTEDYRNSPNFWGEPDYPDAEDRHDYGSSNLPEMTRGVLGRTSQIQPLVHHRSESPLSITGRDNGGFSESFELRSMEMANAYGRPEAGASGNDDVDPTYAGERSRGNVYGSPLLTEHDWHASPQGQKLIASLIALTPRDRNKVIRNQPRTMEEKRNLRKIVNKEKSKHSSRVFEMNCCTQWLRSISLVYQKSQNSISEVLSTISLWQKTLKVIGGKFGTSVLSYFNFLKWLLKFNIFAFIVNFSFITIPQFTVAEQNLLHFTGLEFLTGAGYFQDTVMYYGFYTNTTIQRKSGGMTYNMQLAYIFTIGACLVICFFSLLFSMARYFRNNFINPHLYTKGIAKLVFCWDFTMTHEKAVQQKQRNFSTEIRENLCEILQKNTKSTLNQRLVRLSAHAAAWFVSTSVAVACCLAVYYLAEANSEFLRSHGDPGAVLLLPFVVSCINLFVPRLYSAFRLVEKYEIPRHQVYSLLIRNIFLKISIIAILCYYWINVVALSGDTCWETLIGQEIYRLLLMDFIFSLVDSFVGEFLRRMIGMRFITSFGPLEFDIAKNVLELIYAQTLGWIGIFFSPLLPLIQIITLFITFYVKYVSLMMNFQPPRKAWRASQMMTFFIFLLFFPSFTGVLCTLAITIWRLKPSSHCGPFRGLPLFIHVIYSWIDTLSSRPSYLWVVWIYQNLIGSVHFFFILTLIVLIITYLYWQITEGRKIMIRLLHEQIVNEGKDKMFLIEKLLRLQEAEKERKAKPSLLTLEQRDVEQQNSLHLEEKPSPSDLRYRRPAPEENPEA